MEEHVEQIGNVVVVALPGDRLDAGNAPEFKLGVQPVLEKNRNVVFDMGSIRFVDSVGLASILSCLRQLNKEGGDLKLCGLAIPVQSLFTLVRLDRIFEILSTREEAVEAFR